MGLGRYLIILPGQGIEKEEEKKVWIVGKVKVFGRRDYDYGYWGISYKEWTTLSLFFHWLAGNMLYGQSRSKRKHRSGKQKGTTFVRSPGKSIMGFLLHVFFQIFNFVE
jgi:hypothetical protein